MTSFYDLTETEQKMFASIFPERYAEIQAAAIAIPALVAELAELAANSPKFNCDTCGNALRLWDEATCEACIARRPKLCACGNPVRFESDTKCVYCLGIYCSKPNAYGNRCARPAVNGDCGRHAVYAGRVMSSRDYELAACANPMPYRAY